MDTAQLRIGWALGELASADYDCPAETVGKNSNKISFSQIILNDLSYFCDISYETAIWSCQIML